MRDFGDVCDIYAQARVFMRESGNPNQWKDSYPPGEIIESDINSGKSHVCVCGDTIAAVFYFSVERDPTYEVIAGQWLNDEPYGVVHRIARARGAFGAAGGKAGTGNEAEAKAEAEVGGKAESAAEGDSEYEVKLGGDSKPEPKIEIEPKREIESEVKSGAGVGAFCLNWCFEQRGNIRVDTHHDNAPMQRLLDKLGFTYCGIIWLANGEERLAFQKTTETAH